MVVAQARRLVAGGTRPSGRQAWRLLWASSRPLVLEPVGGALSTAARQRITGQLQARLLRAVTGPPTIAHLEDQDTLNRLASAEGSLTGFFPGDAPVTWGAWYFTGVGSKARDAKEVRVFGLASFVAGRYASLRGLHRRAFCCFAIVVAGNALAIYTITDAVRTHQIGLRSMAIMLPMLAVAIGFAPPDGA